MTAFAVEGHTNAAASARINRALPLEHKLPSARPHVGPVISSRRATAVLRNLRAMHGPLALYVNGTVTLTGESVASMAVPRDEFLPRDDEFLLGLLRDDVLLDGDLAAAPRDCIVAQLTPIWVGADVHDQWREDGLVLDVEPCPHLSTRLEARQGVHFTAKVARSIRQRALAPLQVRAS